MGGQGHFKHAKEMGIKCCWTKIGRGIQRRRGRFVFIKTIAARVKIRTYRNL
jgi:hypothetical protein